MTPSSHRIWVALGLGFALACAGTTTDHESSVAEAQAKASATTPAGKLVAAYLGVQQHLAKDDLAGARKAFGQVSSTAKDPTSVSDAALRTRIAEAAASGSSAQDIAAARKAFDGLSRAIIEWLRGQPNPLAVPLRLAHCPMAFDNKGANWLQTSAVVDNPYFGAEMLKCGSLDAEVQPGQKLVAK